LFTVNLLRPAAACERLDLRLTVDYPEDLILCRAVYEALRAHAPRIPLEAIVAFLDGRPDLRALVAPFVDSAPVWHGQPQRTHAHR
jgi:spore coat polysaccharide biosynthesis protein SpsF (cytidylyltransferase family)